MRYATQRDFLASFSIPTKMKNENEILLETLFVNFINENAERIKAMAAFQRLTKAELLALEAATEANNT